MRKGILESKSTIQFNLTALQKLSREGYKYVQIKGLTMDKHYDYIEPHFIVLVPLKELPVEVANKDIYEPIESKILQQWAIEANPDIEMVIVNKF